MANGVAVLHHGGSGRFFLRRHPAWPVYVLFMGVPVWWSLGISRFMWPVVAGVMLLSLLLRRDVKIPGNLAIWALFLAWMLVSAVALDNTGRVFGFALRFSMYASVAIFFLYLYNAREISSRAIAFSLAGYWVLVVVGGYVGLMFPGVEFTTPFERFIPDTLLSNDYVYDMVHAKFAEVQDFLGYPIGRPTTFFTYTNGWGSGFALLAPFAFAAIALTHSRGWRLALGATVALSIVPVVASLNRGLWISLVIASLYAVLRTLLGPGARQGFRLLAIIGALALIIIVSPLGGLIGQRFSHGHSDGARKALYGETFARAAESPLIGYGAPRPAESNGYLDSAGTQGQVLYLVFSHGFPGLFLFFAWLGHALSRSARALTPAALAGHITLLVAVVQAPFYGLLTQMFVVGAAAAVALRQDVPVEAAAVSRADRRRWAAGWLRRPVPAR
jgi:polysaccharide biosynthesis protein PslJ